MSLDRHSQIILKSFNSKKIILKYSQNGHNWLLTINLDHVPKISTIIVCKFIIPCIGNVKVVWINNLDSLTQFKIICPLITNYYWKWIILNHSNGLSKQPIKKHF